MAACGDAARLLERADGDAHGFLEIDDVGQDVAERVDARLELVLLAEHPLLHLPLDGGAQRIEQDQDDERGDQRVEEEHARLIGGDPRDEQAVDRRQDEHEGGDDHHAAEELRQIEQAIAEQRLRDEVEVDDREDVAERGKGHAELGQEVERGEGDGAEPADEEVLDARLFDARDGAAIFAVELEHRRVEAAEDVAAERDGEGPLMVQLVLAEGDGVADGDDEADGDGHHPARRRRARGALVGEKDAEEADRRDRDQDRRAQRHEIDRFPLERRLQERGDVPRAEHEAEDRKQAVGALATIAQHHRGADGEAHDGGEKRRQRLNVHGLIIASGSPSVIMRVEHATARRPQCGTSATAEGGRGARVARCARVARAGTPMGRRHRSAWRDRAIARGDRRRALDSGRRRRGQGGARGRRAARSHRYSRCSTRPASSCTRTSGARRWPSTRSRAWPRSRAATRTSSTGSMRGGAARGTSTSPSSSRL